MPSRFPRSLLPVAARGLLLLALLAGGAPRAQAQEPDGATPLTTVAAPQTAISATLPAGFALSPFVSGLHFPTDMAFLPNGDLLIAEKGRFNAQGVAFANIVYVKGGILQPTPVVTIPVSAERDSGLFGIVLDPAFETNHWFYIWHATSLAAPGAGPKPTNRIARLTFDPATGTAPLATYRVVLDGVVWSRYHNGGGLRFLPDGTLLMTTGDANLSELAPDLASLNGKLLRIRPTASGSPAYTIPPDNPFVTVAGARPEIYALGLRNPWRITARASGADMVVADVGQNTWEEIDRVARGANYGWPVREGPCPNGGAAPCSANPGQYTPPWAFYQHMGADGGGAITGLAWYEGTAFPPPWRDRLFFADYDQGFLGTVQEGPWGNIAFFGGNTGRVVDLEYFRNSLYLLDVVQGTVQRLDYANTQNQAPVAVLEASTLFGRAPLTVSFSAAGSTDNDDPTLRYLWDFGDGSPAPAQTAERVTHTYPKDGAYTVELRVRDTRNALSAPARQVISVYSGELPTIGITIPQAPTRTRWFGGDVVTFSANRSTTADLDPETPYTWRIELHHNEHVHPEIVDWPGATGGFDIPTDNHGGDTDIHYRFILTMRTAAGQLVSVQRDFLPTLTTFGVNLAPAAPGFVWIDGVFVRVPAAVPAIAGTTYELAAEPELVAGRDVIGFSGWQEPVALSAPAAVTGTRVITAALPAITYTLAYTPLRDANLIALPLLRR